MDNKTILLFGSFDGLHPGHRHLLEEVQKKGGSMAIVVAQDDIIFKIKGRLPKYKLSERVKHLKDLFPQAIITPGDVKQETWSAIKKYRPRIVMVGYDQNSLKNALSKIQPNFGFTIQLQENISLSIE